MSLSLCLSVSLSLSLSVCLSLSCVRACVRAFASRRECHRLYTHMKIHEGIDACTHTRADLGRKERGARAGAGEHEYEFAHEAAANCI